MLRGADFEECPTIVGVFRHRSRDLKLAVHVDDILSTGCPSDLQWLQTVLSAKYDVKSQIIGSGFGTEGTFLKRSLRWTARGLEWMADLKHEKTLIAEWASPKFRRITLPVSSENLKKSSGADLTSDAVKRYRSATGTILYLSHDRPDLSLAACIASSKMSGRNNLIWFFFTAWPTI